MQTASCSGCLALPVIQPDCQTKTTVTDSPYVGSVSIDHGKIRLGVSCKAVYHIIICWYLLYPWQRFAHCDVLKRQTHLVLPFLQHYVQTQRAIEVSLYIQYVSNNNGEILLGERYT